MKTLTHGKTYNSLPLCDSTKSNTGFYKEILQSINSLLSDMNNRHNKVFFIRFDLTFPTDTYHNYPKDNSLLSQFLEALSLHCNRRRYDLRYCWVREISPRNLQHHYHCFLALNGNFVFSAYGLFPKIIDLWSRCLGVHAGGLAHLCVNQDGFDQYGGIMVIRIDPEFSLIYQAVFQIASYMAKRFSKGDGPKHVREFGMSRL
ncbi:MAG: hypothetical protein A2464_09540 [Deltaproteobacteria bacterium RIFOXYC2_FULL_48_10]|nr:MAG: hypothetical protein A2464_09540 [Deltaproteobacteria bacterium RIFOXYC2_FULL_48_10]